MASLQPFADEEHAFSVSSPIIQNVPPDAIVQKIVQDNKQSLEDNKQFIWEYRLTQGDETFYYRGGKSFYITKVTLSTYYVGASGAGDSFLVVANTYDIVTGSAIRPVLRHHTMDTNVTIHPLDCNFIPPLFIKQDSNMGFYLTQFDIGTFQNVKMVIYGFFAD